MVRRALAVLALLLIAVPALAAPRYVGTWVYGTSASDNVRMLRFKVRDADGVGWGSSMGTGYTPYLEVRKVGATAIFATVTGSWADSTEKDALFSLGTAAALAPVSGYQDYEFYLVIKKAGVLAYLGSDDDAGLFLFRAQRWP